MHGVFWIWHEIQDLASKLSVPLQTISLVMQSPTKLYVPYGSAACLPSTLPLSG